MTEDSDLELNERCKIQWKKEWNRIHKLDPKGEIQFRITRPHVYIPPKVKKFLDLQENDYLTFWSLKNKNNVIIQKSAITEKFEKGDTTTEKLFYIGTKAVEYRKKLEDMFHNYAVNKFKVSIQDRNEMNQILGKLNDVDQELEEIIEKNFRGKGNPKEILESRLNEDVEDFSKLIILDIEQLVNDISKYRTIIQGLEAAKNEGILDVEKYSIFYKSSSEQLELLEMSLAQIKNLVNNLD